MNRCRSTTETAGGLFGKMILDPDFGICCHCRRAIRPWEGWALSWHGLKHLTSCEAPRKNANAKKMLDLHVAGGDDAVGLDLCAAGLYESVAGGGSMGGESGEAQIRVCPQPSPETLERPFATAEPEETAGESCVLEKGASRPLCGFAAPISGEVLDQGEDKCPAPGQSGRVAAFWDRSGQ